ncbi:hypothetical protein RJT34_11019 [Clitoria ternatea]|uniref:Uncharacterized protein n=1 Tax=Clitoria ternatea TaxID=43366 RepID=A0AAN9PK46_CLITE
MMGRLYEISRQAKNALEFSRPSEKQGQECSALARDSDLVRFLETLNTTDSTSGHRKLALLTGLKNKNDQTLKVPTDTDAREASKRERCESKAKKINNKLQRKLKERKALRKKLEEIEKEIALLLPKKRQSMNNSTTDQDALNATTVSVSKGRDEEFAGLYDAGIEGFKNRKEFEDEVRAIYSKGVKNGILEARATLLALEMRFKEEQSTRPALKKNEEHVKVAADNEISVQQ